MSGTVAVIGLDGATFDLIDPLVRSGRLPHISRMIDHGARGELNSTIHPLTPQAWASMATGTNPGRHGVFDFGQRKPGSYNIELVTAAQRHGEALWETASRHGKSVGVINMPLSWPFRPVNGFMLGDMHAPSVKLGTYPDEFWREVLEICPDYRLDVMRHWYDGEQPFIQDVEQLDRVHCATCLGLFERYRPQLFVPVLLGIDRTSHAFFGRLDLEADDLGINDPAAASIVRAYEQADSFVGAMLDMLGPDDTLLLISDHGFGRLERDVNLNHALIQAGLLCFDPQLVRRAAEQYVEPEHDDDPRHAWHAGLVTGPLQALPQSDAAIAQGRIDPRLRSFETVDWPRTRAFAHGLFGNVSINLRGREPQGAVWPGRDYHLAREELRELLAGLVDPDDGLPIVDKVWFCDELYDGPQLHAAPDIVLRMRDYAYITRGACEFLADQLVVQPVIPHTGNHRQNGILIAHGRGIEAGTRLQGASLIDIAPTVLHLLGLPVPAQCDGRLLEPLAGASAAVQYEPAAIQRDLEPPSREQNEQIRQRLAGLGYMV
ncbi:MAG: alkaline phosphatase family protein [Candidatus Alcyoniella australis]|nr:alkaline phosphatase family protein [Candidatus Alcyoniella australis]